MCKTQNYCRCFIFLYRCMEELQKPYFNIEIFFRKELKPGKYFLIFNYFPKYKHFQQKTSALKDVC